MNSLTRSIFNLAVVGSIIATCALAFAGEQKPAVPVSTAVARKHAIEQTLGLTGSVRAFKTVTVYSKVTGVIEKLTVERGMSVERDDVIAEVEHKTELAQREQLAAAVKVADAALAQANAQLENAALEKTRAENLYKDKSIPKQKYDAIMAQYRIAAAGRNLAAANLVAAKKALEQMDVRISDYTIRAPITGVVTARFVDEGAMDNPALPIVELMDTSILKINCDVAQVDAAKVKEGQEVKITTDAYPGVEFEGKVAIVNPSLDSKTRTLPVEIHTTGKPVAGKGEGVVSLKPGMFVKLSIKIGEKTTLAVPRDCLMRLPGTGVYYLFVVKEGKSEKRTVEVGVGRGNLVEIISGVTEGDRVVIRGQANLKSGTPVIEAK
ncbi:MAG: hypothetical protein DRH43_07925 [Deltaproteobacteria bacterium]|nr:MAG: hypothetical protein DRH43_07925 [Deltaproteobacteria bacterium]